MVVYIASINLSIKFLVRRKQKDVLSLIENNQSTAKLVENLLHNYYSLKTIFRKSAVGLSLSKTELGNISSGFKS